MMMSHNKPFYLLNGTIFSTPEDLSNLLEVNEVFREESLIDARRKAFNKFQSYLEVFLQSLDYAYTSYEDTVKKLNAFVDSHRIEYAGNNPELGQLEIDFDKGLFLYLVTDPSDTYTTKEGKLTYNQKYLVHFFNNNFDNYWRAVFNDLQEEFGFYLTHQIESGREKCSIKTTTRFKEQKLVNILSSPIDFQRINHNTRK
jgi:hypothetical protein